MRRIVAIALLILAAGPAGAREAAAQDAVDSPPVLRVRPSGVDALNEEARLRQEQLEARMRRNEFLFRNICRNCSRADDPQFGAPFEPLRALRPGTVPEIE